MSDSLNANLVLSYFPCSDFPGLSVCDGGDFGEMHTTKINSVADTSTFFANVTGLIWFFDPQNLVLDAKIIVVCALVKKTWPKMRFCKFAET